MLSSPVLAVFFFFAWICFALFYFLADVFFLWMEGGSVGETLLSCVLFFFVGWRGCTKFSAMGMAGGGQWE